MIYTEKASNETMCGRYHVQKSEDALQTGELKFENMARVKRLQDSLRCKAPLAMGSDCTKVRARLSYSNDYGGHVLGSVLSLSKCRVEDANDIDDVINEIKEKNAHATQTRAIMMKVRYLPLWNDMHSQRLCYSLHCHTSRLWSLRSSLRQDQSPPKRSMPCKSVS